MKRVILLLSLFVLPLLGEPVTKQDRQALLDHLQKSRQMFLDSIAGLSEAQWSFKPGPDRWSVAECAEHIAASEDFLLQLITEKVMKSPADPKAERKVDDARVLAMITNRTQRAQAPEPLRPTKRWTREELARHFEESRARTVTYAGSSPDLRNHFMPNPALGAIDAYQWLLFLSGHTERHTMQIKEVKADPGYPKN